jgi:hypothetical protein
LPEQTVPETLSQKHPPNKRAGGVAQGVGPEFKSHNKKITTNQSANIY